MRKPIQLARRSFPAAAAGRSAYLAWLYGTVAGGVMTMLLAGPAWKTRRRGLTWLSAAAVLATLGLAAVTISAQFQGRSAPSGPDYGYGNDRGVLEMGTCQVSIPPGHRPGEVERPSVFRFEFAENQSKHVVL